MELMKWLSVCSRYTKIYLDKHLESCGLGCSQYLYLLRVCKNPGITQDCLMSSFHINPSNITKALAALEKDGFLDKKPSQRDRRTCCLYPTDRAMQVYAEIEHICSEWYVQVLCDFTPQEKEQLELLLARAGKRLIGMAQGQNDLKTEKAGDRKCRNSK